MPSDFDRLISGYRLTQTALLRDPYCTSNELDAEDSLAKFDENRRAVGMLNPLRDKNGGMFIPMGQGTKHLLVPVTSAQFVRVK